MAQYPNHPPQPPFSYDALYQGYRPFSGPSTEPHVASGIPGLGYLDQPASQTHSSEPMAQSFTSIEPMLAHPPNGALHKSPSPQPDLAAIPPSAMSEPQQSFADVQADAMNAVRDLLRLGLNPMDFKSEGINASVVRSLMLQMSSQQPDEKAKPPTPRQSPVNKPSTPKPKEKITTTIQTRSVPTTVLSRSRPLSRNDSERSQRTTKNKEELALSRAEMIKKRLAKLPATSSAGASPRISTSSPPTTTQPTRATEEAIPDPPPVRPASAMSKAMVDADKMNETLRERIKRLQQEQQTQKEAKAKVEVSLLLPEQSQAIHGAPSPADSHGRKRPVALDFENELAHVLPAKRPFRRTTTTASLVIDLSDDEDSDEEVKLDSQQAGADGIASATVPTLVDFPILSEIQLQGSRFIRKNLATIADGLAERASIDPKGAAEIQRLNEKQREMEALELKIRELESKRKRPAQSVTPATPASSEDGAQVMSEVSVVPSTEATETVEALDQDMPLNDVKPQVDSSDSASSSSDEDAVMSISTDDVLEVQTDSVDTPQLDAPLELRLTKPILPRKDDIATRFSPYDSPLKSLKLYKLSPSFLEKSPAGYKSLTYSSKIDSSKEFCRYETSGGTCNDPGCEEQHFGDLEMTDQDILNDLTRVEGETAEQQDAYRSGLMKLIGSIRDQISEHSTPTQTRDLESAIVNYRISTLKGQAFSALV